ncbi:hypothetical protein BH10BDE1_BH10BDE1_32240 [soil metagenome]
MDTEFDFKPINEGLGFHRKVKPLEVETDSDEMFSFSTLGPGTLQPPKIESNSREQSKGLLSSGAGTNNASASATTVAKSKHNAKSVSDLIAALPPSLDFLLDDSKAPEVASAKGSGAAAKSAPSASSLRKSPLFSQPSGIAKPGATAAASMAGNSSIDAPATEKRGFLKMPLGRSDYTAAKAKTAQSNPSSLDENVAKTFPTVFPHLGNLAGKPASAATKVSAHAAAAKAAAMGTLANSTTLGSAMTPATAASAAAMTSSITMTEVAEERPLAAHFGSAILDTLVAVALGCVLLAVALSITNVNLLALLENSQTDRETIWALALLFVSGGLLYVLAARSFVGATLGEWSYEIRVGDQSMRTRWFYPVLVVWRGLLVAATGFVVIPVVSLIAGRDVLKYVTGLGLVSSDEAAS